MEARAAWNAAEFAAGCERHHGSTEPGEKGQRGAACHGQSRASSGESCLLPAPTGQDEDGQTHDSAGFERGKQDKDAGTRF